MWNQVFSKITVLNCEHASLSGLLAAASPDDVAYKVGLIVGRVIGMSLFVIGMCYLVHRVNPWNATPKQKKNSKQSKRQGTVEIDDIDD